MGSLDAFDGESGGGEAAAGAFVGCGDGEPDFPEVAEAEGVFDEEADDVAPVFATEVVAVADGDAEFGGAGGFVDVAKHAVADDFSALDFDGEP